MKGPIGLTHLLSRDHGRFPDTLRSLISAASSRTIRLTIAAVVIAWVPAALLSALHGLSSLESFLADFAAQSRFLIVIPLLILAEPSLEGRLEMITRHFLAEELVREEDRPRFEAIVESSQRLSNSLGVRAVMVLLVYMNMVSLLRWVQSGALLPWCFGGRGIGNLSPAGSWYALVSLPIMLYFLLRWIWRQMLWTRFIYLVSRMDLQLIPSHPDLTGGLGFVESCLRGYLPFSFAMGTIVAGAVANKVLHLHQSLLGFKYVPLIVIAIVLFVCVGPLCLFLGTLLQTKRRGIFEYGALAIGVGRQLEKRWLRVGSNVDDSVLKVEDFSTTTDLFSVITNVHRMQSFPVGVQGMSRLIVWAVAPFVPVALASVPFDVLMEHALKLLF